MTAGGLGGTETICRATGGNPRVETGFQESRVIFHGADWGSSGQFQREQPEGSPRGMNKALPWLISVGFLAGGTSSQLTEGMTVHLAFPPLLTLNHTTQGTRNPKSVFCMACPLQQSQTSSRAKQGTETSEARWAGTVMQSREPPGGWMTGYPCLAVEGRGGKRTQDNTKDLLMCQKKLTI